MRHFSSVDHTVTPLAEDSASSAHDSALAEPDASRPLILRGVIGAAVVLAVVAAALVVTGLTGLDAPGPLHRYRYVDLATLADLVDEQAGEIRTPDDCWRLIDDDPDSPLRTIAKVDYLRSRVVVRLYARQLGKVDPSVRNAAEREIRAVIEANPEFTRDMVVTEASPDGWSPKVTCRVGQGNRIAGF